MNDGNEWQLALPEFLHQAEKLLAKSEECLSHLHLIRNDSDAIDCMKISLINLAEKAEKKDEKPGFFSGLFGSKPDKEEVEARAERYQVRLSKVGENVQVTVEKNINTVAPADVARKVLSVIQDNLG